MGHDTTFTECIKQHYFGMVFNQWLAPTSIKQNPAFMPEAVPLTTFIPYGCSHRRPWIWEKKRKLKVMWSHEGCADCYRHDLKPKWPHPHIHSQHKNLTIGIVTTIVPKTQNCSTHPISSSRHAPSAEAGASYQASCCSRPRCSHPENKS